ncbi:hypothetical protein HNV11_15845 [Spirosoma taeanense]|uniref:Uncharacterized protein n=1 Tax=Spirosoma taeanense TaxID=2735870 RepID=A0A6M5Y9T9_9BACT|nr:hypothetical protein [Spirosoma taeanense]QJW90749.1 hypothetical protein HNV11_15845 [Spirosoma taeanense]
MTAEYDTDKSQPALIVLSITQKVFDEIRLLYTVFGSDPLKGIDLLRDDPTAIQYLKNEYDRLERMKQNPHEGSCRIVFLGIRRLPDGPRPNSGDDVRRWLYSCRIEKVLQYQLTHFRNELRQARNEVEKENRSVSLQSYRKTLDDLCTQLSAFERKTADQFPELNEAPTVNWPEIYERLNDFMFLVRDAIEQYIGEIKPYLKDSQHNDSDTSTPAAIDDQKNNFNSMALQEVRQWFIKLADNNSKNGKPFLTAEQVEQFIERAFVGSANIPKLTFNIAKSERTSVTKLFYLYYQRCTQDYAVESTKHCKQKYVQLLTDHFTNYEYKTVFDTFNNSQNAKKDWK